MSLALLTIKVKGFTLLSMESLVELKDNIPKVDTVVLAREFNQKHEHLYKLLKNHQSKLVHFGVVGFEIRKPKTGRPMNIAYLNEPQALLLLTYTRSREETDNLRIRLISDFTNMKNALLRIANNQQNQEWLDSRKKGKAQRRLETDIIKEFIEYAKKQGSKSPDMYYTNISKMENSALFMIEQKFPNVRAVLEGNQLNTISVADNVVENALKEGMSKEMFYKDIYKLARERVLSFSNLIPKTVVPLLLENNKNKIEEKKAKGK